MFTFQYQISIFYLLTFLKMSESFEFDVAYSTTFEQIETLRSKMLAFVKAEGRDFLPSFDVSVKGGVLAIRSAVACATAYFFYALDIPDQEKMTLSADIKYKSNWQQGAVKGK